MQVTNQPGDCRPSRGERQRPGGSRAGTSCLGWRPPPPWASALFLLFISLFFPFFLFFMCDAADFFYSGEPSPRGAALLPCASASSKESSFATFFPQSRQSRIATSSQLRPLLFCFDSLLSWPNTWLRFLSACSSGQLCCLMASASFYVSIFIQKNR